MISVTISKLFLQVLEGGPSRAPEEAAFIQGVVVFFADDPV
jgi:hypothetical protein